MTEVKDIIKKLINGNDIDFEEAGFMFQSALDGTLDDVHLSSFLTALAMKGESVDEIYTGAYILRKNSMKPMIDNKDLLDTCGTGGDGIGTYNVSTGVAFVCAAAGIKVAKHGNRSVSSRCGSFDVLEELGCNIMMDDEKIVSTINESNLGFMYAPIFHGAMKNVAPVRKKLGFRTIFNILGPLANPAGADHYLMGVFCSELAEVMAGVLDKFNVRRALIVHGCDGLDEITITGDTEITELNDGNFTRYTINPSMYGMSMGSLESIKGGDVKQNADMLKAVLKGEVIGSARDILKMNSGAAIYAAGKADSIGEGTEIAGNILDAGKAYEKLNEYIELSKRTGGAV